MSAKSPVCEIPKMGSDEIRQRVAGVKWFHTIDFGQGIVSPGDDDSPGKLKSLQIPRDLSGKTFLDIGAWDGFFSFENERRDASRFLAVNSYIRYRTDHISSNTLFPT